ncbi:MAG TPA: biotin/lipoyl-binding protein, partial [Bacteroidales bacterium]|nr:biotin/lipoyl-binding protein [Bacteroidales bacterium]
TAEQPKSEPVVETKSSSGAKEMITSPLPGNVLKIEVEPNAQVKRGDILIIIEAMKMENNILAPHDGIVEKVFVKAGDVVMLGDELISMGK